MNCPVWYVCWKCHKRVDAEDTVWVSYLPPHEATTGAKGRPFHVGCAPSQE